MYGDLPVHGNIKIYRLCYIVSSNNLLYSSVESIKYVTSALVNKCRILSIRLNDIVSMFDGFRNPVFTTSNTKRLEVIMRYRESDLE